MGAAVPMTTDTLASGSTLGVGDMLVDASGRYRLTMQADGNLVLSDDYQRPWWASNTSGHPGASTILQGDGNLVVYAPDGITPLWAANTAGHPGDSLVLQQDRNLVLYAAGQSGLPEGAVWSTGTYLGGPTVPAAYAAGTLAGLDAATNPIFNDGLGGFYQDASTLQIEGLYDVTGEATGEDATGLPIVAVAGPPVYNVDGSPWSGTGANALPTSSALAPSTAPLATTAAGTVVVAAGPAAGQVVGAVVTTTAGVPVGVTTTGAVLDAGSGASIGVIPGTPAAAVAPAGTPLYPVNTGEALGFGPPAPGPLGAPATPASLAGPPASDSLLSGTTVYWILGAVVVGLGVFLLLRRH